MSPGQFHPHPNSSLVGLDQNFEIRQRLVGF
jgi:hypothetical protein